MADRGFGTQAELSAALEVAQSTVMRWLNAQTLPPPPMMRLLAEKLGVRFRWLANGNGPQLLTRRDRDFEHMLARVREEAAPANELISEYESLIKECEQRMDHYRERIFEITRRFDERTTP
jgi:transcriptional regulator with XRE-family HTH domain